MTKAAKIRRYLAKGMTPTQIMKKLGCSSSEVYRLVPKKKKKEREQGSKPEQVNPVQEVPPHANELQIGGEHYKALNPQPWDVISAWNLGFLDGNVVKYVARFRSKGGIEDLKKAKHYLDKLIEQQA